MSGAGGCDGEEEGLEVEGGGGVVEEDVAGVDGHLAVVDVLGDVDGTVDALIHADCIRADCKQDE